MAAGDVPVVCGPTAAGKSAIALSLAARHALTIVSADSRQIYRGFDIGTAKPSAGERASVPHRGIDVAEPTERWSAARWADAAAGWIDAAAAGGRPPIVVGGTGFYLRALFAPLFAEPPLDPVPRAALERELGRMGISELRRWCERLDPGRAHLGRVQLTRSIEVALLTGRPLSEWHRVAARAPRFRARYLLVDPGAALATRIATRIDAMLEGGWVDEVRRLAATIPATGPAWNATGYGAIRDLVEGRAGAAAARERVVVETRQYAKRQRTWFRHQLAGAAVTRLDPTDPGAASLAERWWRGDDQ